MCNKNYRSPEGFQMTVTLKKYLSAILLFIPVLILSCDGTKSQSEIPVNNYKQPVLGTLAITDSGSNYIEIAQPVLEVAGYPEPSIKGYIGREDTINIQGSSISGFIGEAVDLSSGGYRFSGLSSDTVYRIAVIAQNGEGYSVKQITCSTGKIAPVLNDISIDSTDSVSITLNQPSFTVNGSAAVSVKAYIGLNGTITANGKFVTGYIGDAADVTSSGVTFSELAPCRDYRIIVIAENSAGYSVKEIVQSTGGVAPVMNYLSVINISSGSVTLEKPSFSVTGNPAPAVYAYIGFSSEISVSGSDVSGYFRGPVDVSNADYQFNDLAAMTEYRIVTVAENSEGYSVKQVSFSTAGISPVLNDLVITGFDIGSVSLEKPAFLCSGNPLPSVNAYIGKTGTITVTGKNITGSVQGPVNVASGGYMFQSLAVNTVYTVVVVAENSAGYSVKQISLSTAGIAPVLNDLAIESSDASSITLSQPVFITAGNPLPVVKSYIGKTGTISVSGNTVSGYCMEPHTGSSGAHQFSGLEANRGYTIVVVAENSQGYSVKQISHSTEGIAPVMNDLSIQTYDDTSITINRPTFSVAGNPSASVHGYIGRHGEISVSGATVSGYTAGPVDLSAGGFQFTGLLSETDYRIVVVAGNSKGHSVKEIACGTARGWHNYGEAVTPRADYKGAWETSIASENGILYAAVSENKIVNGDPGKISVMKLEPGSSAWGVMGSSDFSEGMASSVKIAVKNGVVYTAYYDSAIAKVMVKYFDGTSWRGLGTAGVSAGAASDVALYLYDTGTAVIPCVAYVDGTRGNQITVKRYTGGAWQAMGSEGFSAGLQTYSPSLCVVGGTYYIAFQNKHDYVNTQMIEVRKFNGSAWEQVGRPVALDAPGVARGRQPVIAADNGTLYLLYSDFYASSKATVKYYDSAAGSWVTLGVAGFTPGNISNSATPAKFLISNGVPFVVFINTTGYCASMMQYENGAWGYTGNVSLSAGQVQAIDFIFNGGDPYVIYRDLSASNGYGFQARVRSFDLN